MKYLRRFKTKADAVGQTMPIPSVLSIEETPDSVGYLNTDIGIQETNIVETPDQSFVEGEYMQYITVTYNVTTSSSTTKILYTIGNVTKMFYGGGWIPASTSYVFPEIGEQSITFALSNKKCVTIEQFKGCNAIIEIQLGSNIKVLRDGCYNGTSLENITLPNGIVEIASSAFSGCVNLKSITIPDSVVNIGSYAFCGCKSLTGVTIPSTVISIGKSAFIDCSSLSTVTIEEGVKMINPNAFQRCIALQNITTPKSVNRISNSAFCECINLTTAEIKSDIDVIYACAFYGCSSLADVTIPNTVRTIGQKAFEGCKSLTGITIPNSVSFINESAFYGCENLTSLTIPDSVYFINSSAFSNCFKLSNVSISKNISSIANAFYNNCTSLPVENNVRYAGDWAVGVTTTTATTYTLRNGTKGIANAVFSGCTNLTGITIPDSITHIQSYAFEGCTKLSSINIPDSVTSIGTRAFSKCNLFPVENNVRYAGDWAVGVTTTTATTYTLRNGTKGIADAVFSGCTNLTGITIPDSIIQTHFAPFEKCHNLASINIPPSVKNIHSYAFKECKKLSSINIPDSVSFISPYAFSGCTNLTNITIGNSVEYIDTEAFAGCTSLTGITMPDSLKVISSNVFMGCTRISNITMGNEITSIDTGAFMDCTSLTGITIPNSVKRINSNLFDGCTSLSKVILSDSIEIIFPSVFQNCRQLTEITFPNSPISLGGKTFYGCSALTGITIPDSIKVIGSYPFYGCSNLTKITIGTGLKCLYPNALNTGKIMEKSSIINNSSLDLEAFEYGDAFIVDTVTGEGLYILNNTVIGYDKNSSAQSAVIPDGVTSIDKYALSASMYTGITIPDSVTSIGYAAFSGCTSLPVVDNVRYADRWAVDVITKTATTYTLMSDTKGISDYAFSGCTSLTGITIPDSVTSIGSNAFLGCAFAKNDFINNSSLDAKENDYWGATVYDIVTDDGVCVVDNQIIAWNPPSGTTTITIPEGVENIREYLFYSEPIVYITDISLPSTLKTIGDVAFAQCVSLTGITIPESVESVGIGAFLSCPTELYNSKVYVNCPMAATGYTIPDTVSTIAGAAFYACQNITSITLPASVSVIEPAAFIEWAGEVTCLSTQPPTLPVGTGDFEGMTAFVNSRVSAIYVPSGSVDAYKSAWTGFLESTDIISAITT